MPSFRTLFRPAAGSALLLAAFLFTGCSEGLTSVDESAPVPQEQAEQVLPSKFRHQHLFIAPSAAPLPKSGVLHTEKLLSRYEDLVATNDFVVAASSIVLDMNKLLSRYETMEGVTVKRSYKRVFKGFAIHVESSMVSTVVDLILADPEIEWVEPDARASRGTPTSTGIKANKSQLLPWGVDYMDAELVFDRFASVAGNVELYILDSGISSNDVNVVEANCFTCSTGNSTSDKVGHGTHVAGIAAAVNDTDDAVGVAPGARVHDFKVLDDNGQTDLSTVIAAVDLITERKVQSPSTPIVVNISFGADIGTTEMNSLDDAIAASIATGVVYVIAAGNEGIDAATVTPAHVPGAITVASHDLWSAYSPYSNYGATVDLVAPGEGVRSLYSNVVSSNTTLGKMSGTSMAAPHVAGAAVLYLAENPTATPAEVREALVSTGCGVIAGAPTGTTNVAVYANGTCPAPSTDSGSTGGGGKGGRK